MFLKLKMVCLVYFIVHNINYIFIKKKLIFLLKILNIKLKTVYFTIFLKIKNNMQSKYLGLFSTTLKNAFRKKELDDEIKKIENYQKLEDWEIIDSNSYEKDNKLRNKYIKDFNLLYSFAINSASIVISTNIKRFIAQRKYKKNT